MAQARRATAFHCCPPRFPYRTTTSVRIAGLNDEACGDHDCMGISAALAACGLGLPCGYCIIAKVSLLVLLP
jgi:hypothetical protein